MIHFTDFLILCCCIGIIIIMLKRFAFRSGKILFIPSCYIGFVIGTIIVCVMGGWYVYEAFISKNGEGEEAIAWLTLFIGLPFTLLIVPLCHFCDSIGIRLSNAVTVFSVFILCLLNWSVIGYALSLLRKRE